MELSQKESAEFWPNTLQNKETSIPRQSWRRKGKMAAVWFLLWELVNLISELRLVNLSLLVVKHEESSDAFPQKRCKSVCQTHYKTVLFDPKASWEFKCRGGDLRCWMDGRTGVQVQECSSARLKIQRSKWFEVPRTASAFDIWTPLWHCCLRQRHACPLKSNLRSSLVGAFGFWSLFFAIVF
jgi:hypothetical protein